MSVCIGHRVTSPRIGLLERNPPLQEGIHVFRFNLVTQYQLGYAAPYFYFTIFVLFSGTDMRPVMVVKRLKRGGLWRVVPREDWDNVQGLAVSLAAEYCRYLRSRYLKLHRDRLLKYSYNK